MNPDELESAFLAAPARRSRLLSENVKDANREYDKLYVLKERLRSLPDRGESILKRITIHPDVEVAIMAAASLLAVDELYAIEALERIASSAPGLTSFTAEKTIREWKAGHITDYWR